jgi:hypothetical protein
MDFSVTEGKQVGGELEVISLERYSVPTVRDFRVRRVRFRITPTDSMRARFAHFYWRGGLLLLGLC